LAQPSLLEAPLHDFEPHLSRRRIEIGPRQEYGRADIPDVIERRDAFEVDMRHRHQQQGRNEIVDGGLVVKTTGSFRPWPCGGGNADRSATLFPAVTAIEKTGFNRSTTCGIGNPLQEPGTGQRTAA
jgi:hypothetical protein